MALQTINIGTVANDNTGDDLRTGGGKINDNFQELYSARIIRFYDGIVVGRNIDITAVGYTPVRGDTIQILPDSEIEEGTVITLSINNGTPVTILGYTSHNGSFTVILTFLIDYWGLLGRQAESYAIKGVNMGSSYGTPSSPTDTGVAGEIKYDDNYLYVCYSDNNWHRFSKDTWT